MSMSGWAREGSGGLQQVLNLAKTSLMVLTGSSVCASAAVEPASRSAAPQHVRVTRRRLVDTFALLDVGGDLHLHHQVGVGDGTALRSRRGFLELVDDIHAGHHFANHRIFAIERGAFV